MRRPPLSAGYTALALLWAGALFWMSSQPRWIYAPEALLSHDKLLHALAYAVGAALVFRAVAPARLGAARAAVLAAAIAGAYGATDEWHQSVRAGSLGGSVRPRRRRGGRGGGRRAGRRGVVARGASPCGAGGRGLASAPMSVIVAYDGKAPRIAASAFLAPGSVVTGDVEIGEGSSVWFQTVIRGDVNFVRIGARTNVQDHSVVHVTSGTNPTVIGDDVTIGHRAVLHGCTVKDRCLVGIAAIVLDGAVLEPESMVGAGALVPPGMVVPSGKLVLGAPAKVKRDLTPEEIAFFRTSAERYAGYAARYRQGTQR